MTGKICILGNGRCAEQITEHLLAAEADVIIATRCDKLDVITSSDILFKDNQHIEILTKTHLISCSGTSGNFRLRLSVNGVEKYRQVSGIVVGEKEERRPNDSLYGLVLSDAVIPLSRFSSMLDKKRDAGSLTSGLKHVVFLNGLVQESHPVIVEEILQMALVLQSDLNVQGYVLTKNLKVAGEGIEKLYRQTKEAGTFYVKFCDALPKIRQDKDGGVRIEFIDDITGQKFRLQPELVVVDETIVPSNNAGTLAQILELDTDLNGFLQADNVNRLISFTNRKGILVAGPARDVLASSDPMIEADSAAGAALRLINSPSPTPNDRAQINTGQCVRCLTCFRLCPYRAIQLNTRVTVSPEACESCGICAAECPRGAIHIPGLESNEITQRYLPEEQNCMERAATPFIVAFCCARSATRAGELATNIGFPLPEGLKMVEVPCAGSISVDHILGAFINGVDGMLLFTCHEGNCHSERGNIFARRRMEQLADIFSSMGFEKERLNVQTIASNMGREFAEIVNGFEHTIRNLDLNRLKEEK